MKAIFTAIKETCNPKDWSKAVDLGRRCEFYELSQDQEKIAIKVLEKGAVLSRTVTLWFHEEDWFCNCGDERDPCLHVVSAAIALKQAVDNGIPLQSSADPLAKIAYRFKRKNGSLALERVLLFQDQSIPLACSLQAITSGRVPGPRLMPSGEELTIDRHLKDLPAGLLPVSLNTQILTLLEQAEDIQLDGEKILVSAKPTGSIVRVEDHHGGVQMRGIQDPCIKELFRNGFALCLSPNGEKLFSLRPVESNRLSSDDIKILASGQYYGAREMIALASEFIPSLEKKIPVEILSKQLPKASKEDCLVRFETEEQGYELMITPRIVYGNPAIASVKDAVLNPLVLGVLPVRDLNAEKQWQFKLSSDLGMELEKRSSFSIDQAFSVLEKIKRWEGAQVFGEAQHHFVPRGKLSCRVSVLKSETSDTFEVNFESRREGEETETSERKVSAEAVLEAWDRGESYVRLLDASWAPLPRKDLERMAALLKTLLSSQKKEGLVQAWMAPGWVELMEETGSLKKDAFLREKIFGLLEDREQLESSEPELPSDLRAELRPYQKMGVQWLLSAKRRGVGAMLADDMGLGKTLQTLCVLGPGSLIIAPTSVIYNWEVEIRKFRPGLSLCLYHGAQRKLDLSKDLIITSYALLRLDLEILSAKKWNTIVLDEAQNIKNPDSIVARSVFSLQASFRLALTGTPLENHLEDIWSSFHFLNRGLLASRKDFSQWYVKPIAARDERVSLQLKRKLQPFILRRLKAQVAAELPPMTEAVLYCELSESERALYESLRLSTRAEVQRELGQGAKFMRVLELLLRLRQAACHSALLSTECRDSSKTDLLMNSLKECVEGGHYSLVFSQWTSFLDLLEPELKKAGISFSRIDGLTQDRSGVVDDFQEGKFHVLLLSLKAAGVGLNLTRADHVFIMDPWWNPAVEAQARDRAHRIGQMKPVMLYRLVAKDTLEEKIIELQRKKLDLAGSILDDGVSSSKMTQEDILSLFD